MGIKVQVTQRTPEWYDWRAKGIGGSDAPAVMFEDAHNSPYQLWRLKVGLRQEKKPSAAALRGVELEDQARNEFCKKMGDFLPAVCMQHEEYPFMLASLDGVCADYAFEVKVPKTPKTHVMALEGEVPRQYYAQCQHNLAVSGRPMLYFVSYYPSHKTPIAEVPVTGDPTYLRELIESEREFWSWVTAKQWPAWVDEDREVDLSHNPEWKALAAVLWNQQAAVKAAEDALAVTKAQMARLVMRARVKRASGAGVKASWIHTKERTQTMPESVYLRVGHEAEDDE